MSILEVSEHVKLALSIIDQIDEEGLQLLETAQEELADRISRNESALAVIVALGGQYDRTEDECKAEEARLIVELLKVRLKYREYVIENAGRNRRNADVLRAMGV